MIIRSASFNVLALSLLTVLVSGVAQAGFTLRDLDTCHRGVDDSLSQAGTCAREQEGVPVTLLAAPAKTAAHIAPEKSRIRVTAEATTIEGVSRLGRTGSYIISFKKGLNGKATHELTCQFQPKKGPAEDLGAADVTCQEEFQAEIKQEAKALKKSIDRIASTGAQCQERYQLMPYHKLIAACGNVGVTDASSAGTQIGDLRERAYQRSHPIAAYEGQTVQAAYEVHMSGAAIDRAPKTPASVHGR